MRILYLSPWFPYPPIYGSKIRLYNLLSGLAEHHEVTLISFTDTEIQPVWIEHIKQICSNVILIPQDPFRQSRTRSIIGWISPRPSSVVATYSPLMQAEAQRMFMEWHPDRVIAYTFVTAPYALGSRDTIKVLDIENLMFNMMHENYQRANGVLAKMRRWLAWKKFLSYERNLYTQFGKVLVASKVDKEKVAKFLGIPKPSIDIVPNGAQPSKINAFREKPQNDTLIFTGSLTYHANYEAIYYFLDQIFPLIIAEVPNVHLRVTGSTKGVDLKSLRICDQVEFTGFVDDINSLVTSSWVSIVPILSGGGTRLKILESMAYGTPVISTSKGAEGLDIINGEHILIADSPGEFAKRTIELLHDPLLRTRLAQNAHRLISENYNWDSIRNDFCRIVESAGQSAAKHVGK